MSGRWRVVKTQAELDACLKDGDYPEIRGTGEFLISDSSTVTACGSSTVTACDSSTVRAYGSSTVIVPIGDPFYADKVKVKSCTVLYECDEDGEPLTVVERVAS